MRVVRNFCGALGTKMVSVLPCAAVRASLVLGWSAASSVSKKGGDFPPPKLTQPDKVMATVATNSGVFQPRKAAFIRDMGVMWVTAVDYPLWLIIGQAAAADYGASTLL